MYNKVKMLKEGQECRKCNTPVIRKLSKKALIFKSYLYCPGCASIYFIEAERQNRSSAPEATNINPNQKQMFIINKYEYV